MITELELKDYFKEGNRRIWIYLPSSYDKTISKKYPVLYMFDGHNLFYDDVATYGKSWGIKKFLDKKKLDIIVVGVDCNHDGNNRLIEYSPFNFSDKYYGEVIGKADKTVNFFVNELKPYIDINFRTLKNQKNTFIAGSSMGGLMSYYTILSYPNIFSKACCISSSFEFNPKECIELSKKYSGAKNIQLLLHFGALETKSKSFLAKYIHTMLEISNNLTSKGIINYPYLVTNGKHNEASWEKELKHIFDFLLI